MSCETLSLFGHVEIEFRFQVTSEKAHEGTESIEESWSEVGISSISVEILQYQLA